MRADEVVVVVGLSLIVVAMAVSVAGLFQSLDLHVTRKCPLSRHGECQCTMVESGGRTWRPDCSGRSLRCKRRRRVLRDFPDGVSPDGDL